jgi:peptidoglycan/xylan/chitin deacetylase (PgdA/CDA1 family)
MRANRAADQLRIALSHYVDAGAMPRYRAIVERALENRRPMAPEEAVAALSSRRAFSGRRLLVTFDDGLLSSYEAAQEVLNPLGVRAIYFVPTKILELRSEDEMRDFFRGAVYRQDTGALPPERYVTMTSDHLKELRAQGHLIMPHTHMHARLDAITSPADIAADLEDPRKILEDLLGEDIRAFAFPFGTEAVVSSYGYAAVRRTYGVCFTGLRGANAPAADPFFLYRDCLHPTYPMDYVDDLLGGSLDPVYALKMRRLRRRAEA